VPRQCLLGALHGDDLGVPGVREVSVEELEPGRRLDVSELQVSDMGQAEQRAAGVARGFSPPWTGTAEFGADDVRFTRAGLDSPVGSRGPAAEDRSKLKPAMRRQRRMTAAHASSSTAGTSGSELADTSTGSGRIVSWTRLPAGSAEAFAVVS